MEHRLIPNIKAICGVALLVSCAAVQALQPSTQGDPYVFSVWLKAGSSAAVVTLRNASNSTMSDSAQIQPVSGTLQIPLDAIVTCVKDKKIDFDRGRAYFGPALMAGGSIDEGQTLFSAAYEPSAKTWAGLGSGQWITEAGNSQSFDVPLASVKNGPANIGFDPVAEFNKRLQTFIQGGGKKIDFLRSDQQFAMSRTISVGGWCKKDNVSRSGVNSAFIGITVKYVGDKNLTDKAQVNVQLGNSPNQINQNLPMKLVEANFQPNMPHYIGSCSPAQDPLIRVNYSGSGKGVVRFSIEDGSAVYGTQDIAFDASNGPAFMDFNYPLNAKLASIPAWAELNKTVQHTLTIRAKYRDEMSTDWSDWKSFGSTNWNHRCTPQVNAGLGGSGGILNDAATPKPPKGPLVIQQKPPVKPLGVLATPIGGQPPLVPGVLSVPVAPGTPPVIGTLKAPSDLPPLVGTLQATPQQPPKPVLKKKAPLEE